VSEWKSYIFIFSHQNEGQNNNIQRANKSFKIMVKFKDLGIKLVNENYIHTEVLADYIWGMFAAIQIKKFVFLPTI
jgi:hypothetical protein